MASAPLITSMRTRLLFIYRHFGGGFVDLMEFLIDNGIGFNPIFDGNIHRYEGQSKKSKSGWYVGFEFDTEKILICGDWTNPSLRNKWFSKKSHSKNEKVSKIINEIEQKIIDETFKKQNETSLKALSYIEKHKSSLGLESLEYAKNKLITSLYGASLCEDNYGLHIAIEMKDSNDKIWSIQKIYNDGQKFFLTGGKKKSCFFRIGEITDT